MITITRRLAMDLRSVLRRALNLSPHSLPPSVGIETGPDGLRARAWSPETAVEYHLPGRHAADHLWLPFQVLVDTGARKDDPVELQVQPDGRVQVHWREGAVPQLAVYDLAGPDRGGFPSAPDLFAENPSRLLKALEEASQTTDPDSARYALGCIQLDGRTGAVAATDGRQLLVQTGFQFPWQEGLLVAANKVYGSRELLTDQPVSVGRQGGWIAVRVGPWAIYERINQDGRFPDVERQVPHAGGAVARIQISPTDAQFLAKSLPRLPGDQEFNYPVTVDLNGSVAIRAKAEEQPKPTELILSGSTRTGDQFRLNMNRKFLARALGMGFQEVHVFSPKSPVLCQDDHRQYVWALLDPESAIGPAEDAIRIESPGADPGPTPQQATRRTTNAMSQPKNDRAGGRVRRHTPNSAESQPKPAADAVQQVVALRDTLRAAVHAAGQLIKTLRHDKRQAKQLKSALASLHDIQTKA